MSPRPATRSDPFALPKLFILVLICCISFVAAASAEGKRIALVIGNGAYAHVGRLDNPVSDADLMAESLAGAGFEVTKLTDADQNEMKRGIAEFGRSLRQAGTDATALFYYAGHAVQSFGRNYLLPVDSNLQHQADLVLYGVEADGILRQLFAARLRASIVILDACRNNPFTSLTGFADEGLAEMDAPTGTFIAYSTAPGRVAADGIGNNSPYTAALARAIASESLPIEQLFKRVRVDVLNATGGVQTPWDSSSLTTDFYFRQPNNLSTGPSSNEEAFWQSVRDTEEIRQLELFLDLYPDSAYRSEANERIAALGNREGSSAETAGRPVLPSVGGLSANISAPMTFETPITEGVGEIVGKSIEQVYSTGSPLFPPFEGIPDELWKGQKCSNCHQWTRELLCDQGKFYLSEGATRSLEKKHPLGGTYKKNLARWASTGCR